MNPLCFRLALSEYFITAAEREGREKVFLRSLAIPATMRFLGLWNCFVVSMWKSLEPRAKKKALKCWKQMLVGHSDGHLEGRNVC